MIIECPVDKRHPVIVKPWNDRYNRVDCYTCKISKFYNKKEQRFAKDTEINLLGKEWE